MNSRRLHFTKSHSQTALLLKATESHFVQ